VLFRSKVKVRRGAAAVLGASDVERGRAGVFRDKDGGRGEGSLFVAGEEPVPAVLAVPKGGGGDVTRYIPGRLGIRTI
jgi:hypothetical protein